MNFDFEEFVRRVGLLYKHNPNLFPNTLENIFSVSTQNSREKSIFH